MTALTSLFPEYEWQQRAECGRRAETPSAQRTFADRYFSSKASDEQKKMCGACVVREDCLSHALTHNEPGIWAATTKAERTAMKKGTR